MPATAVDHNGRLLESVLRDRSRHGGWLDVRPGLLLGVSVVLLITGGVIALRLMSASPGVEGSALLKPANVEATPALSPQAPAENPAPADTAQAAAVPVPTVASATVSAAAPARRYVVKSGDTVQSIAESLGLRAATLASVNDLADPDVLQPGRELVVPAADGVVHIVQPGETLRAIAERYGVDIPAIVDANDLADPDNIAAGLRLFVPGAKT